MKINVFVQCRLKDNDVKVNRSRKDAGSYAKDIIEVISENSKLFYIKANRSGAMTEQINEITSWPYAEINDKSYHMASILFKQFFKYKNDRLVVIREKNKDGQTDLFTGYDYIYRSILANDYESSEGEVISYYNQRGATEKIFDIQNNDFG